MQRVDVLAYRIHAQQLDREPADRALTDAAILDFGVQDSGRDGASWALANRGVPVSGAHELENYPAVALAWTLRSAPHYYRRAELVDVLRATSPLSEADAAKRIIGAAQPLEAAGIRPTDGLAALAAQLRAVVTEPKAKGQVSTEVTQRLAEPYVRPCVSCGAVHSWEIPFRMGAFYAGLELQPGTSPPVLRRIPGWPERKPGPAADPLHAPPALQPIRNYLRFLGPATPREVATFLDAAVADVKAHWPEDAVEVQIDGRRAWWLAGAEQSLAHAEPTADVVRLLGGFDLFLQAKDRSLVVPDRTRHQGLWPALGRPGAVLADGEIVGTWRPRATGRKFTLRLELWTRLREGLRARLDAQAERLAAHRAWCCPG